MKHLLFLLLLSSVLCYGQEEMQPWERLGLSKTEWKMIQDNHMPMSQVEDLLKDGIGISEYFKKPWVDLNLTEQKWIEKRRSGMSNYDIETQARANNSEWKSDMKNGFQSEISGISGNGEKFSALIPGLQQFKTGNMAKGVIMSSIAVGTIGWCIAGSIANKQFNSLPIAFLVVDIGWSFIDYNISKRHKKQ